MNLDIDKKSPVPIYYQLAGELEKKIAEGAVRSGENLPGTMELAESLDINPSTVNKAFSILVDKGLIERIKRAGTFVRDTRTLSIPSVGFFYFLEAEEIMSERAEKMQCLLSARGHQLKIVPYQSGYFDRFDFNEEITRRNLRGAVISGMNDPSCRAVLKDIERREFPAVMLGSDVFHDEIQFPLLRGDEYQCSKDALEYLWSLGHRRIGLISYHKNNEAVKEYRRFFSERGAHEERWLMSIHFSGPGRVWEQKFPGPHIARGYLEANPDITALVIEHTYVCIDFVRQAKISGRDIPGSLSILSLHDSEILRALEPPVSAMHISHGQMVEAAVEELFKVMTNSEKKGGRVRKFAYRLVERESVAEPSKELCVFN